MLQPRRYGRYMGQMGSTIIGMASIRMKTVAGGPSLGSGRALYVLLERAPLHGEKLNFVTNTVGRTFLCFIQLQH